MKNSKYTSSFARRSLTIFVSLATLFMLSACGVYKINVQQGNYMDQKKIDQVAVGMTRNQVRYLLGTPMITDSFHKDRWDYVYRTKIGRTGQVFKRKMSIYFDGDAVREVDQYGQNSVNDAANDNSPQDAAKDAAQDSTQDADKTS